ncbi:MAG: type II secretion system protein GspG [Planctomycetota bacterium]
MHRRALLWCPLWALFVLIGCGEPVPAQEESPVAPIVPLLRDITKRIDGLESVDAFHAAWPGIEANLVRMRALNFKDLENEDLQAAYRDLEEVVDALPNDVAEVVRALGEQKGIWSWSPLPPEKIAAQRCRELYNLVKLWMMIRRSEPPESLTEMEAPLRPSDSEPFYVREKDPWGRHYEIVKTGTRSFRIRSAGPDGKHGSDDDIAFPDS